MEKRTQVRQVAAPATPKTPTVEEMLVGTESGKIWDEIKDKTIDVFAIPNQKVNMYVRPVVVEPSKLYLVMTRASAALPALETAIGNGYAVELVNKYVVVSRPSKI